VIFDKTGTLTIGKPVVVGTKLFRDVRLHVFYNTIAAAEVTSRFFLRIRKPSLQWTDLIAEAMMMSSSFLRY
jgi:hypothetical protein